MATQEQVRLVLEDAADYVDEAWDRFGEGMPRATDGRIPRDAWMAMIAASEPLRLIGDGRACVEALAEARDLMRSRVQAMGYGSVCAWNEAPGRTKTEVSDLFREVAAAVAY